MVAPITNRPSLKKLACALIRYSRGDGPLWPLWHMPTRRETTRDGRDMHPISSRGLRCGFGSRFAPKELTHPRVVAGVAQDLGVSFGDDALDTLVEHDHSVRHGVNARELVGHDDERDEIGR